MVVLKTWGSVCLSVFVMRACLLGSVCLFACLSVSVYTVKNYDDLLHSPSKQIYKYINAIRLRRGIFFFKKRAKRIFASPKNAEHEPVRINDHFRRSRKDLEWGRWQDREQRKGLNGLFFLFLAAVDNRGCRRTIHHCIVDVPLQISETLWQENTHEFTRKPRKHGGPQKDRYIAPAHLASLLLPFFLSTLQRHSSLSLLFLDSCSLVISNCWIPLHRNDLEKARHPWRAFRQFGASVRHAQ